MQSHFGQAAVLEWVLEEMCHPPYYSDLTPSDYHLFPNLKKHFHRQRFKKINNELKYATEEWLKGQSELFYFTGIENLCDSYELCVGKGNEYVENKCVLVFPCLSIG